jgi:hypothetical protein
MIVTPTEVIIETNWLSKSVLGTPKGQTRVPIRDITSVVFAQRGGFPYLQVLTNGVSAAAHDVRNAVAFPRGKEAPWERARDLINEYRGEAARAANPPTVRPAAVAPIADELEKLAALRERGILTDEEFAAKKRQLLDL